MPFDWQQFRVGDQTPSVVNPRRRLFVCFLCFLVALTIIWIRLVQLEVSQGAGFRAEALKAVEKKSVLPAMRGRILARDGTPLAFDRKVVAIAVEYRWLQNPPDPRWLRTTAKAQLPKKDRKNAQKVAEAQQKVLSERTSQMRQLAAMCHLSPEQWEAKTRKIQSRVERISASANRRRESGTEESEESDATWAVQIRRLLLEDPPRPKIIVAEELASHVVVEDIPPKVAAAIKATPIQYPGVQIVEVIQRNYPRGKLAAHVLGHLGAIDQNELATHSGYLPDDLVGRLGIERQHEPTLHGRNGEAIERRDRSGRLLTSYHATEPVAGRDVRLTIDLNLQETAEKLLENAIERRSVMDQNTKPGGGAIVVMDVRSGAVLAAASAPAFDPNWFARGDNNAIATAMTNPSHPMFDRVCRMALPPGSTFKTVTALALLESKTITPETMFSCQGYLHRPDQQRCELFVSQGIGHGQLNLADALAVSCNVFFFHFADKLGPRPLIDWAEQLGFGKPTGIDLPGEAAGALPSPEAYRSKSIPWKNSDTQSMAIGQGGLAVTPLQMAKLMAAVANGGQWIEPHVGEGARGEGRGTGEVKFRSGRTLASVREGLRRVVSDPSGTGHETIYLDSTPIAGKTGTAEVGGDRASHAWFAGYAPADAPKLAFVIVLEHAGDAATATGPLAKRLVLRMEQLGLLY